MNKIELIKIAIDRGFKYEPETGIIIGKRGNQIKRKSKGYIDIALIVDNKLYHLAGHQFAFYYCYGFIPKIIDHIDRNRSNNAISNLRAATSESNNRNVLGKGYYKHSQTNKFCAQITYNYKHINLGCYDTEEEAKDAYLKAKLKYHGLAK